MKQNTNTLNIMSFIQDLYKKRSNYSDPDQATMQENSLEKLSSGIYTEGERFVFELLQNAVDAHRATDCLNVSICIQEGYLIFMHNGEAFTNEDIEGICFVGRKGEKVRNAKKIGYNAKTGLNVSGIIDNNIIATELIAIDQYLQSIDDLFFTSTKKIVDIMYNSTPPTLINTSKRLFPSNANTI